MWGISVYKYFYPREMYSCWTCGYLHVHVVEAIHNYVHVYVYTFMLIFKNMKHEI